MVHPDWASMQQVFCRTWGLISKKDARFRMNEYAMSVPVFFLQK